MIPTIEEYLKENLCPKTDSIHYDFVTVPYIKYLIELHVQAALKDASENAALIINGNETVRYSEHSSVSSGKRQDWTVSKESILESYPLTNIK